MDIQPEYLAYFEQLNEIGVSLSSQVSIETLLEAILKAAKTITHADGGTLYRMDAGERVLHFAIVRNDSLGIAYGGKNVEPIPSHFSDLPLYNENGVSNDTMVAAYAAVHKTTVNIADAYTEVGFDFSGTRGFDRKTGYRSESFLTVPMKNHEGEVIGVLQLINAQDEGGKVKVFSDTDQHLAESLASQAAVALTNRLLIDQLEALFESFISVINMVIDEKSPYTAGHCERVSPLTMMIAEACLAVKEGPLASFSLSEKERYELKIAAMLHDCGKLATPVHIVDKATKLQTIFDRIALIETRAEVIARDAKMAYHEARLLGQVDAQKNYEAFCQKLADDLLFLKRINKGAERMSEKELDRLSLLAKAYAWQTVLGTTEYLLTDEEVHNLAIFSGTLTQEERALINSHIDVSIKMLASLPWPKHLKRVPEYAGAHHERMDGKGYPNGLTASQMSYPARMMAVADIFEALTAKDRPYKEPMKISEALHILEKLSQSGHIDPDIFEVFRTKKVYRRYAETYLSSEQNDLL